MSLIAGVDIGGTFTDVLVLDDDQYMTLKVPSDRDAPERAVIAGLDAAAERFDFEVSDIAALAHGTTVATNVMVQEQPAETALVTTRGFRDVLEIGYLRRPPEAIYDPHWRKPDPLIPRSLRFEVTERVAHDGSVVTPPAIGELESITDEIARAGVRSVAVVLLFSFLYPAHEREVGAFIQARLPDVRVLLSSDILPEVREYERTSTTAIAAYLGRTVARAVRQLEEGLASSGIDTFYVMQSNGGLGAPDRVLENPGRLLMSGPAAGVSAVEELGKTLGIDDLISADMGGTSFDLALVRGGAATLTTRHQVRGAPLMVPMIDILTIGAGGGSIAWLDDSDGLHVGPRSAGAQPGPACYPNGGSEPTVTDANLVLGLLNPSYYNEGRLQLDPDRAAKAINERIAGPLGLSQDEAAFSVFRIINSVMADAMRLATVKQGQDPREFALVAFGGAGPVHAAFLARELDIPWTIVPAHPGLNSALGLTQAAIVYDFSATWLVDSRRADVDRANRLLEGLMDCAHSALAAVGVTDDSRRLVLTADVNYRGQGYPLQVPIEDFPLTATSIDDLASRFHSEHEATFGFSADEDPVVVGALRVRAIGRRGGPTAVPARPSAGGAPEDARKGARPAFIDGAEGREEVDVYDRAVLAPGTVMEGPVIIEARDTTVVVPGGVVCTVDAQANLILGGEQWQS